MFFHRRTIPGLSIHTYLVGNEATKECAVIDPVRDVDEYMRIAADHGLEIRYILETHVHADFISGSPELKQATGGKADIYCSGMGGQEWTPSYADCVVKDGDEIVMGNLVLRAVHTPGHTPEHIAWLLSEEGSAVKLFTGDLLFVGSIGRPDLLGEEEEDRLAEQLYHSVFHTLNQFPDSVEIRPAHGAGSLCSKSIGSIPYSSMGIERSHNPYLKQKPQKEWTSELMKEMPPIPPYFARMKKINVAGGQSLQKVCHGLQQLDAAAVKAQLAEGALVLDLRSKEAFSGAHIPGSVNIPISPQVSTWSGWVLPYPDAIILLAEEEEQLESAFLQLVRIGYDHIVGFLKGGIKEWEVAGFELARLPALSVDELRQSLDHTYVLDVRTKGEWDKGHISGAHFLEGAVITRRMDEVPKDVPVAIICGSGFRASAVGSILQRAGYENVSNVFGGMQAWIQDGLPIEKASGE